jgi:uncharacterized membrane-anchored protein YhcB (DUF1043 family)
MGEEPESFRQKILLLVIDKIIIGALIALAVVIYDHYKTKEAQQFQAEMAREALEGQRQISESVGRIQKEISNQSAQIQKQVADDSRTSQAATAKSSQQLQEDLANVQLRFELARSAKEFLPFITNKAEDPITRGYTLREAVGTGAIAPEAAVVLGSKLLSDGLPDYHFRKIMPVILPDGIWAIGERGAELTHEYRTISKSNEAFYPNATVDPESGVEHIPENIGPLIREARSWKSVVADNFVGKDSENCPKLRSGLNAPERFFGLYVLLNPGSMIEAELYSECSCEPVAFVGNVARVGFDSRDTQAVSRVAAILRRDRSSAENLLLDDYILTIFAEYYVYSPERAVLAPVAEILTDRKSIKGTAPGVPNQKYWLQWKAADVLDKSSRQRYADLSAADPVLIGYVDEFYNHLSKPSSVRNLSSAETEYGDGTLLRRVVSIVKRSKSPDARRAIERVGSLDEGQLRDFPFLYEEIHRDPVD